jgi:integrase/recombinase XerD
LSASRIREAGLALMVFTFARVSAAVGVNVGDLFRQKKRLWVRLHEKGGKVHDMPTHHTLEEYLSEPLGPEHTRPGPDP